MRYCETNVLLPSVRYERSSYRRPEVEARRRYRTVGGAKQNCVRATLGRTSF